MKGKSIYKITAVSFVLVSILIVLPLTGTGGEADLTSPKLTLYSAVPALVEFEETLDLKKGKNEIGLALPEDFVDNSVLVGLSPGRVVSYSIERGLGSEKDVLKEMKGREIEVVTPRKSGIDAINGKLIDLVGGAPLVEKTGGSVRLIKNPVRYSFSDFPKEKMKDKLKVKAKSEKNQSSRLRLAFQQKNLSWKPLYVGVLNGVLNEKRSTLNFQARARIINRSDRSYENVDLTLVAGEPEYERQGMNLTRTQKSASKGSEGPERGNLFEFHTYSFDRPVELRKGETKILDLARSKEVPVEKRYLYRRAKSEGVFTWISFENKARFGLGLPLPAGPMKLYSRRKGLKFLGGREISNVSDGEEVTLPVGKAFDLSAEAKLMKHEKIDEEVWEDRVVISLTNRKEEDVTVEVRERLKGSWKITSSNLDYEKVDAHRVRFSASVPADKSVRITYTYQYRY